MIDPLLHVTLKSFIAVILMAAGLKKILNTAAFIPVLSRYVAMPGILKNIMAYTLPVIEILIAVSLFVPALVHGSATVAFALFLLYAGLLASAFLRGNRDFICGCALGQTEPPARPVMLLRNIALISASAAVLLPVSDRILTVFDGFTIAFCTLALTMLYVTFEAYLTLPDPLSRR